MSKVPVAEDAKTKSYYKYYEMEIADLTEQQRAYIANCKGRAEEALSIHDRAKLQEPGENRILSVEGGRAFGGREYSDAGGNSGNAELVVCLAWPGAPPLCNLGSGGPLRRKNQ